MNLESARNRIKIIEGLLKRIDRYAEAEPLLVCGDVEVALRQCRFLEMDLRDSTAHVGKQYDAHCGGVRE